MSKYLAIYRLSFIQAIKNYKFLIGLAIFLLTCMIIYANLWKVAAARVGIVSYTAEQLLWYIAFNEWVLIAIPDLQDEMEADLRTGRLAYQLPRPISYIGSIFASAMGALTVNLTFLGLVTFLFTWQQTHYLPFTPSEFVLAIFLGLGAGILAILFRMLVGLTGFWLHEVDPFFWIYEKSLFMFGGLMLPLTIYPVWMQTIAQYTPFPVILGGRSALALGFDATKLLSIVATMATWIVLTLTGVIFLYRRGLKILNIQGG